MLVTANTDKKIKAEIATVGYSKPNTSRSYPLGRTRIFGVYCSMFRLVQLLVELFVAGLVYFAALNYWYAPELTGTIDQVNPVKLSLALTGIVVICNCCLGLYTSKQSERLPHLLRRFGLSLFFASVSFFILFNLFSLPSHYAQVLIVATLVTYTTLYSGRLFIRKYQFSETLTKKVLILGSGNQVETTFDRLYTYSEGAYSLYRLNEQNYAPPSVFAEQLLAFISNHDISEIVLAYTDREQKLPMSVLIECKLSGIAVRDPVEFLERESGLIHFDFLDMSWIISADGFNNHTAGQCLKRLIDIIGSSVLLVLSLPIFVLVSVAIRFDKSGPGPVYYRQVRVGLNGKLFKVWKFRSMFTNAEASGHAQWATENDCRVTAVGAILRKYRLDELPQLFNVIKGEMSLVGPRPERPEFVSQLSELHALYTERHRVMPGLTGWAQMRFPYTASADDSIKKLQYDMYYIKNRSWLLDVLILLQTVEVVLCGKGAR